MLNQDQYYASLLNKGQKLGDKFESAVRSTQHKLLPLEPDNATDVDKTIEQVCQNDSSLKSLNWNNIKNISKEKFQRLFKGLAKNTHLKSLSVANTGLTDSPTELLVEALKENTALIILNVESNYISNIMVKNIIEAINKNQTVIEFRAANQGCSVLGNKLEMEIAELIEHNNTMLRLGLHFEITNACMRVAEQLQINYDKVRVKRVGDDK
ncbi:tropomodulin-like [Centruroides sculpturatus]|uniref:tropomodulin-like n=1 Tax=Centruroides sculpturatus TaxID=218467 RepID=UPI000C6DC9BD|nr:tropomodulin-like [Centruroides sculpturatus]